MFQLSRTILLYLSQAVVTELYLRQSQNIKFYNSLYTILIQTKTYSKSTLKNGELFKTNTYSTKSFYFPYNFRIFRRFHRTNFYGGRVLYSILLSVKAVFVKVDGTLVRINSLAPEGCKPLPAHNISRYRIPNATQSKIQYAGNFNYIILSFKQVYMKIRILRI